MCSRADRILSNSEKLIRSVESWKIRLDNEGLTETSDRLIPLDNRLPLIRSREVAPIPSTASEACFELGFDPVIKTVQSAQAEGLRGGACIEI